MVNRVEGMMQDAANLNLAESQEHTQNSQRPQTPLKPLKTRSAAGGSARDITTEFTQAASALETGQLVKDAYFTLFESVGALEIMDPKMDSGYLEPGETLEDQYDVSRHLLPEEVIGVMDQMLCYEMAWHMGNPLSQTLFTSFHLDRMLWPQPKSIDEARFNRDKPNDPGNELVHLVLRAYCLGLVKTCDFVHRAVDNEHYYEEEDFVTNLYHRDLLTDVKATNIVEIIDQAVAWLDFAHTITDELRSALRARLDLRKAFLLATNLEVGIGNAERPDSWNVCSRMLRTICPTTTPGVSVVSAFSPKIQRRLASTVPPRPIVNISFDDAHAFFVRTCVCAREAFGILSCSGASHIINFVRYFQTKSLQPPVYVRCLIQSLILSEMRVLDRMSIKQLLYCDLEEITLPASVLVDPTSDEYEAPQHPRFQINAKMETLISRSADAFFEIFRALCMNRSRLRRMLCHLILDWDNIQLDAETLDIELRELVEEKPIVDPKTPSDKIWSFPLSSWAYYHKLQQMEWIVSIGFELQIYRVDELGGMYWYLQHLASTRFQHLERIRTFTNRRLAQMSKLSQNQKESYSRSFDYISFAAKEAAAIQSFADGLSCLYSLLAHLSILPNPYGPFPYSSGPLRYALRMRPFTPLSIPEVPSYTEFEQLASLPASSESSDNYLSNDSKYPPEWRSQAKNLVENADVALQSARKEWDAISRTSPSKARTTHCDEWWLADVKNVQRACIAANIAVKTVSKAVLGLGNECRTRDLKTAFKVDMGDYGKGYHTWWVVPKITVTPQ